MSKTKYRKLEINCNKLTVGNMHSHGRYCSVGYYARRVKGLPVRDVENFLISHDKDSVILNEIMNINDDSDLTWKEKAKEITKLFKEMGVLVTWKNKTW